MLVATNVHFLVKDIKNPLFFDKELLFWISIPITQMLKKWLWFI